MEIRRDTSEYIELDLLQSPNPFPIDAPVGLKCPTRPRASDTGADLEVSSEPSPIDDDEASLRISSSRRPNDAVVVSNNPCLADVRVNRNVSTNNGRQTCRPLEEVRSRRANGLDKSSGSHEEFEFVKACGSSTSKDDGIIMGGPTKRGGDEEETHEAAGDKTEEAAGAGAGVEMRATADQLILKAQLLPLQNDPRLHPVKTLSQGENFEEEEEEEEDLVHSCKVDDGVKSRPCNEAFREDSIFGSQQSSSYWGGNSEEKDSSSSSRCSNGSSLDSLPHKAIPLHPQPAAAANARQASKPSSKTWTWRSLLNKLWGEASSHVNQKADKSSAVAGEVRACRARRGYFEGPVGGANHWSHSSGFGFSNHGRDDRKMGPLEKVLKMGVNARESWHRCVARVRRPILAYKSKKKSDFFYGGHFPREDNYMIHTSFNVTKSLSNTPLTKSPMREHDSGSSVMGPYSSAKYMHLGCTSSCPGSVISSPHHSGALTSSSFNNNNKLIRPSSSLGDLHIAIQGAIDHCKQSQCSRP